MEVVLILQAWVEGLTNRCLCDGFWGSGVRACIGEEGDEALWLLVEGVGPWGRVDRDG